MLRVEKDGTVTLTVEPTINGFDFFSEQAKLDFILETRYKNVYSCPKCGETYLFEDEALKCCRGDCLEQQEPDMYKKIVGWKGVPPFDTIKEKQAHIQKRFDDGEDLYLSCPVCGGEYFDMNEAIDCCHYDCKEQQEKESCE